MMIFYKFPKKLWDLIENLLETMRNENKMANSFRIILDLQNTEKRTIPSNFLSDQTIIYHIHDDNVDEMEGFNDIWANILNDRILPTDIAISKNETISEQLITRQTESSNFSMDEEISDISLERKILVTEQESLFDAINSFNPGY